jgi:hypothetical protein
MATRHDHWLHGDFDRDAAPEPKEDLKPAAHIRLARRRIKGRDTGPVITFKREDTGRMVTERMNTMDPILLLAHSRRFMRSSHHYAMQYGEIRQRVVSPVWLP